MFFASKEKKSGGSRVLTEAEIKKKLYGDYDTSTSGVHTASPEIKTSAPAYESQIPVKREYPSGAAIRSPSFGAASKPETLSARPQKSISPVRSENQSGIKGSALQAGQVVLGVVTGILWKVGSYLVQALDFILRILDPRKPQARKLLYSITACILVAALFIGVFRLNAHRKKAMMGELPAVTSNAIRLDHNKTKKTEAVTTSSQVSGSSEATQLQKEETQEKILTKLESSTNASATAANLTTNVVAPVTEGKYVIQVATYAILDDANRLLQSLNQAGFTAFYKKQFRNSTGHAFYPVYLGRFESFSTAQHQLAKFRKASVARPFQDSFIRTLE